MGRPIVYCGICSRRLSEEDFSKGRAHVVDDGAYCTGCRIVPEARSAPNPTRAPPPTPAAATAQSRPAATPRRHPQQAQQEESTATGLIIAIAVVVPAILAVAAIVLSSNGPTSAPPAAPTGNAPLNRAPDPPRTP